LIRFLIGVESGSLFWLGDLLSYLKQKHSEHGLAMAEEIASQSDNPSRLMEAMLICKKVKTRFNLSFSHHRESFLECGQDLELAQEWLRKSEENGWGVATMRREIRLSRRTPGGTHGTVHHRHRRNFTVAAKVGSTARRKTD
jgi:hypothetical protein